jgi:regulator of protease activity HflC (stomatin/prohibitin superfamily)
MGIVGDLLLGLLGLLGIGIVGLASSARVVKQYERGVVSRQAEAERERRARVISADGELQASHKLAKAASIMADTPAALQLRQLETVVEVAAEKNSTLVLPFPVELLRFLDRATEYRSTDGST